MKIFYFLFWFIALTNFKCPVLTQKEQILIYSISTNPILFNYKPEGSLEGGTLIYIKGTGFNHQNPLENQVNIGSQPCVIQEAKSLETFIVCETKKLNYIRNTKFYVTIYIAGRGFSKCFAKNKCTFRYLKEQTPQITNIYPQEIKIGEAIFLEGYFKTQSIGQITQISVGDYNCKINAHFDIEKSDKIEQLPHGFQRVTCSVRQIPPGSYLVQVRIAGNHGYAFIPKHLKFKFLNQKVGNIYIHAVLQKINPKITTLSGQIFELKGVGFKSNDSCFINEKQLLTLDVNFDHIVCQLEDAKYLQEQKLFLGNLGLKHEITYKEKIIGSSGDQIYQLKTIKNSRLLTNAFQREKYEQYSEKLYGVFQAPESLKNCQFMISSSGSSTLYISQIGVKSDQLNELLPQYDAYGNPTNLKKLCQADKNSGLDFYESPHQISEKSSFKPGQYYYIEIHHKILVSTPSFLHVGIQGQLIEGSVSKNLTEGGTYEIQKFVYHCKKVEKEVIQINLWNAQKGKFALTLWNFNQEQPTQSEKYVSRLLEWDVSENDLLITLQEDFNWTAYGVTVQKYPLNSNGQTLEISKIIEINGYSWIITLNNYRMQYDIPFFVNITLPKEAQFNIQLLSKPAKILKGKVQFRLGDNYTPEIDFKETTEVLEQIIQTSFGFGFSFEITSKGDEFREKTWNFYYKDLAIDIEQVELIAKSSGCEAEALSQTLRNGSQEYFFEAIPSRYLRSIENNPVILVGQNHEEFAACDSNDCSIQVIKNLDFPVIIDAAFNNLTNELTIKIDQNKKQFTQSNFQVIFAQTQCQNIILQNDVIKCSLPLHKNHKDQYFYKAGIYLPFVQLIDYGFLELSSQVKQIELKPQISKLKPHSFGLNGGKLELSGNGFTNDINVFIVDQSCSILHLTTTKIKCVVRQNIQVNIKNRILQSNLQSKQLILKGTNYSFTYTNDADFFQEQKTPIISNILQNTNGSLFVYGKNIGQRTTIFLMGEKDILFDKNSYDNIIQQNLKNIYENYIEFVIEYSILKPIIYKIEVYDEEGGFGSYQEGNQQIFKLNNQFQVVQILPQKISLVGGVNLTIQTRNLQAQNYELSVSIGQIECNILSRDQNELKCFIDYHTEEFLSNKVDVKITRNGIPYFAVCSKLNNNNNNKVDSCTIDYQDALKSAVIQSIQPSNIEKGQKVTIKGRYLCNSNQMPRINLGNINIFGYQIKQCTNDTIQFEWGDVPFGQYGPLRIYYQDIGYAQQDIANFYITNKLRIYGTKIMNQSTAGILLNVTGNGFQSDLTILLENQTCHIMRQDISWALCHTNYIGETVLRGVTVYSANVKATSESMIISTNRQVTPIITEIKTNHIFIHGNLQIDVVTLTGYNLRKEKQVNTIKTEKQDTHRLLENLEQSQDTEKFKLDQTYISSNEQILVFIRRKDNPKVFIKAEILNATQTQIEFQYEKQYLTLGKYIIVVFINGVGLAQFQTKYEILPMFSKEKLLQSTKSSYLGGAQFIVLVEGFRQENQRNEIQLQVCGIGSQLSLIKEDKYIFTTPSLDIIQKSKHKRIREGSFLADSQGVQKALDGLLSTHYESHDNNCYIQYDAGEFYHLELNRISIYPNIDGQYVTEKLFNGLVLEGSDDNSTYTDIIEWKNYIRSHWSIFDATVEKQHIVYRFLRIRDKLSISKCNISEIQIFGSRYRSRTGTHKGDSGIVCDVKLFINGLFFEKPGIVEYQSNNTPIINKMTPQYLSYEGDDLLTITGQFFGEEQDLVSIRIDTVKCIIEDITKSQIKCRTQPRQRQLQIKSFQFIHKAFGYPQINCQTPVYAILYSQIEKYLGYRPQKNSILQIKKHQSIIIDQNIHMSEIIVEGSLIITEPTKHIKTKNLLIFGGTLEIGDHENPFSADLLLEFVEGGKLNILNGKISIYGHLRQSYYEQLKEQANNVQKQIKISGVTKYRVGDVIVISGTQTNQLEQYSELHVIEKIDEVNNHIQLTDSLKYNHEGGNKGAYIGVLNRNIVITGASIQCDGDENDNQLCIFSGVQFNKTGSTKDYSLLIENVRLPDTVQIKHCSFINTKNRGIVIQSSYFSQISENIFYQTLGHSIVLSQTMTLSNLIEKNLIIEPLDASNLNQKDLKVAGIFLQAISNQIISNIILNSQSDGINIAPHNHSEGPAATIVRCTYNSIFQQFASNIVGYNGRYGLIISRIYAPSKIQCVNTFNQPELSEQVIFRDFTSYGNFDGGVIIDKVADLIFDKLYLTDNKKVGVKIDETGSAIQQFIIRNSIIVGHSNMSESLGNNKEILIGIKGPKVNGFQILSTQFINFTKTDFPIELQQPKVNDWYLRDTILNNIKFTNVLSLNYIKNIKYLTNYDRVIYDGKQLYEAPSALTNLPECSDYNIIDKNIAQNQQFGNFFQAKTDSVMYLLINTSHLIAQDMNFDLVLYLLDKNTLSKISSEKSIYISQTYSHGWILRLIPNNYYLIEFPEYPIINELTLKMLSEKSKIPQNTIIYLDFKKYNLQLNPSVKLNNILFDLSDRRLTFFDKIGQTYFDKELQQLQIIYSNQNQDELKVFLKECNHILECTQNVSNIDYGTIYSQAKDWNDPQTWPNKQIPKDNEDVEILSGHTIILKGKTANLDNLVIQGILILDSITNVNLTASVIYVDRGSLIAGQDQPVQGKININLLNQKVKQPLLMKSGIQITQSTLIVQSKLLLKSQLPKILVATLKQTPIQGQNQVEVNQNNLKQEWKIGAKLLIVSPCIYEECQEIHIIKEIQGNTIRLENSLKHVYYSGLLDHQNINMKAYIYYLDRNIIINGGNIFSSDQNVMLGKYQSLIQVNGLLFDKSEIHIEQQWNQLLNDEIYNSVFLNSQNGAISLKYAEYINIINNLIQNTFSYGISIINSKKVLVSNNTIISVKIKQDHSFIQKQKSSGIVTDFYSNTNYFDLINITFNKVYYAEQNGYLLPAPSCNDLNSFFQYNEAHGCKQGWLITSIKETDCIQINQFTATTSRENGVFSFGDSDQIIITNSSFAENKYSITAITKGVKSGLLHIQNTYIAGIQFRDCLNCYKQKQACSDLYGIRVTPSQIRNNLFPPENEKILLHKPNAIPSTQQSIIFDQLKIYSFNDINQCQNNYLITPNQYGDTGSTTIRIYNSTINQTDKYKIVKFFKSNNSCVRQNCTGFESFIIKDFSGTVFGKQNGIVVSYDQKIIAEQDCEYLGNSHAILCQRDIGFLHIKIVDPNEGDRQYLPIRISELRPNEKNVVRQFNVTSIINKEIGKEGHYPIVFSLIKLNSTYQIEFPNVAASAFQLEFDSLGSTQNFLLKIVYQNSIFINVQKDNEFINPQTNWKNFLKTKECGQYFQNNTEENSIYINMNNEQPLQKCRLLVQILDILQIKLKILGNFDDFVQQNQHEVFLAKFIQELLIDKNRFFISNLERDSIILTFKIVSGYTIQHPIEDVYRQFDLIAGMVADIINGGLIVSDQFQIIELNYTVIAVNRTNHTQIIQSEEKQIKVSSFISYQSDFSTNSKNSEIKKGFSETLKRNVNNIFKYFIICFVAGLFLYVIFEVLTMKHHDHHEHHEEHEQHDWNDHTEGHKSQDSIHKSDSHHTFSTDHSHTQKHNSHTQNKKKQSVLDTDMAFRGIFREIELIHKTS